LVYWIEDLCVVGGWFDVIGEDIVFIWMFMFGCGIVSYELIVLGWMFVLEWVG